MRIAQVAPLFESIPPQLYGGTERVIANLTEELIQLGHDVTLFCSADSKTRAHQIAITDRALRLRGDVIDPLALHLCLLERVYALKTEFDIIHFHCDYLHYPASVRETVPCITTLHGRLNIPELRNLYSIHSYARMPVVSISFAQRQFLKHINWVGNVYHGLPPAAVVGDDLPIKDREYFAFLGRVSPEKGLDRAIAIAKATNTPLRIAAKVDAQDDAYYQSKIRPLLDHPLIEFVGEISDLQKPEFLNNARALLFPIDWPEPFGLVVIEAMANGTPVLAFSNGSVPEIVDEETGIIVNNVEEAVAQCSNLTKFDPAVIRHSFTRRFSARQMALSYLEVYESVAGVHRLRKGLG